MSETTNKKAEWIRCESHTCDCGNGFGPCTETRQSSVDFEIVRPADCDEMFQLAGKVATVLINARGYLLNDAYTEEYHEAQMDAVNILRERFDIPCQARNFILAAKWLERAA